MVIVSSDSDYKSLLDEYIKSYDPKLIIDVDRNKRVEIYTYCSDKRSRYNHKKLYILEIFNNIQLSNNKEKTFALMEDLDNHGKCEDAAYKVYEVAKRHWNLYAQYQI